MGPASLHPVSANTTELTTQAASLPPTSTHTCCLLSPCSPTHNCVRRPRPPPNRRPIDEPPATAGELTRRLGLQAIRTHYQRAGTALLTLMLTHFDLRQWLGTCKNFFLLYQSDFLTNFLDSAMEELGKEAGKTSVARLRSLLEIAIRTSSLYREPHADQLLLTLDSRSFSELHTVRPLTPCGSALSCVSFSGGWQGASART